MAMKKYEKLKKRLPLYLSDDLPVAERRELEEALEKSPELKQELQDWAGIKAVYQDMIRETPAPAEELYGRILQNIRKKEAVKGPQAYKLWLQGLQDFFKWAFASPKLAWATASICLIISLVMVFRPAEQRYITLGEIHDKPNIVNLNIVFKEGVSEKEIRKLLLKTGTQIVDGPDANGLYVLSAKNEEPKENVLKELNKAWIVRFVALRE
jgi:hypothetical protein